MQELVRKRSLYITSYLSIALSKILPHSKTIRNAKKLSLFGENDSRRLSTFLQTHNFWRSGHISRIYNEIKYKNIWLAKLTIILIMMAQVSFFLMPSPNFKSRKSWGKTPWSSIVLTQILKPFERLIQT